MRYLKQKTRESRLPRFIVAAALVTAALPAALFGFPAGADDFKPDLYVPYKDLAHLIAPADKAVLMDRTKFAELLTAAEANAKLTDTLELGQVRFAEYSATVAGEQLTLTGELDILSIGNGPVAVPLNFSGIGLTSVLLDGKPAPLGYDKSARLTLVVQTRGRHQLQVAGTTGLKELASGGAQFSMSFPQAVAGNIKLAAAGDLEIHATVPASQTSYDKQTDLTSVELTIGGRDNLAVVLLGNGRQEDDRAILLGDSATTVDLAGSYQSLSCLYTVQVLRRGVRQLQFELPSLWNVTEVSSPSLVKWSVETAGKLSTLTVHLRSPKVATTALHIKAEALRSGQQWQAPRIGLLDAAFQRGFLMVNTGRTLGVRGEKIIDASRQDAPHAAAVPGLLAGQAGPLYFHWGNQWSVNLELADVELKRSIKERQRIVVSPQQVTITGDFEVTAVERELFDVSFILGASAAQWQLADVLLDGKPTGFEYRIDDKAEHRLLKIELPRPVQPEKTANITIVMQHVPADWFWPSDAPDRTITAPLIQSQAETVSGYISLRTEGDLDAAPGQVPGQLEPVPVGRMASLGITGEVQHAYSHNKPAAGSIQLLVSRRRPRTSAHAVGLVTVRPREFWADWRIEYDVSRASAKRLYLLADKSLGREFKIASTTVPINSKNIVQPGEQSIQLSDELTRRYNLWLLNLDHAGLGNVVIDIRYEKPLIGDTLELPLVRPICEGQTTEELAIQAGEELALKVDARGAKEMDAVDLSPLPAEAVRILWAFRLDPVATSSGAKTAFALDTDVHENYRIPSALAVSSHLTTYLDNDGAQRTEAVFQVANAGRQFLTFRLPDAAELWSLKVADRQVKPQRSAGGDCEVPLGHSAAPIPVRIVYACRPEKSGLERLNLGGIELSGVEINRTDWTVVPPPGYQITAQYTRMQTHDLSRPTPACVRLYHLLQRKMFAGSLVMPVMKDAGPANVTASRSIVTDMPQGEAFDVEAAAEEMKKQNRDAAIDLFLSNEAQAGKPITHRGLGVKLIAQGRATLPVDLVPTAGAGPPATFAALGASELTVGLTRTDWMSSCWAVGFALIAVIGFACLRQPGKVKATFIFAVMAIASLVAVWRPAMASFANGAFMAGAGLIPLYVLVAFVRFCSSGLRRIGLVSGGSAAAAVLLLCVLCFGCSANAATPAQAESAAVKPKAPLTAPQNPDAAARPIASNPSSSLIVPYEGDAFAAEGSNKVLIPYARYVELWNRAHPEDTIETPKPGMDVSLAAVRYEVTVEGDRLTLLLAADIETYGADWVILPMPIDGLAVVEATIDGKAAQFHTRPQAEGKQASAADMVLMLPGRTAGKLRLKALAKPTYFGRRGSVKFLLPPLPGAVMDVVLPGEDLELEIDNLESKPSSKNTNGAVRWTVPLGMTRDLTLRWLPKAGGGAADSTLSAAATHDVYAFHWAMVSVTRIAYTFSAGEHDRFGLLIPVGATLTEVSGTNIRDYRDLGSKTVDGKEFSLIEVRLHRPAKKQYELTVRWLGELPSGNEPVRLLLVRSADVNRESGTVTLHSAGGMDVKVAGVTGGRRTVIDAEKDAHPAEVAADSTAPVARYYWPYRPFALFVQFSRSILSPKVHLDQLVRLNTDKTELMVQAKLATEQGKLFGASFSLPVGYELLSVVGPAVDGFYERTSENQRFLHVKFDRGREDTKIAMVLVRSEAPEEVFQTPLIRYVDSAAPGISRKGRVAVQVAASLEAKTLNSENLKAIVPGALKDWLDANQINSTQFAYSFETAEPSLQLNISAEPTRIRVETFAGMSVRTTLVLYTYRLRYDISGSPVDNLIFTLPDEYAPLVAVDSPALRTVTKSDAGNGRTAWKIVLINEVTGTVDIAVNFAVPIDASTKLLAVPRIETEAPAGYRAVIAVQNLSRHDISVKDQAAANLKPLAVSEQRKLMMSREMTESLQYVFQSFEQDWSLSLGFAPAKAAARIQAVVDLMEITTVIDRNGRCRYEVGLALQNRSEQFLRVEVPQGLRLWSAAVASEPVKPVTDLKNAASAANQVLIPLVKTSPGGLPYDVYLYFADTQADPLLKPLSGLTNLKPPAISVLGIPITRTTWSLRLPSGYRYMRPGGNMSSVAGTVEMLSLNIEARLDQLKRLEKTYRDVSGSSSRGEALARDNWGIFNQKLKADIEQAQSFLESNRSMVSEEDYARLSSQLGGQEEFQTNLIASNSSYIQEQQTRAKYDLNAYLNYETVNHGIAEATRDNALQQKPDFISEGQKLQIARLEEELEVSEKRLRALQQNADKAKSSDAITLDVEAIGEEAVSGEVSREIAGLIHARTDKKSEAEAVLNELSKQRVIQMDRQQAQLRSQLEELKDNRLERHFRARQPQQMAQSIAPQTDLGSLAQTGESSRSSMALSAPSDTRAFALDIREPAAGGIQGGSNYGYGTTASGRRVVLSPPSSGVVNGPSVVEMPAIQLEGVQHYVAKANYSLPITLPAGEVRLDFARSAGQVQLSIWAVPLTTIRNLQTTGIVLAILFAVLGIMKIWSNRQTPLSVRRAVIYLLLLVVLTVVLGLLGLVLSLATTLAAELLRMMSVRRGVITPAGD